MVFTFDTCAWLVTFIKREMLNYSHQEPLTRWTLIEDTLMWKKISWKTNKLVERIKTLFLILPHTKIKVAMNYTRGTFSFLPFGISF